MSYHLLWSGVGGQLLSYHSYHLLWSGVGGQLLSYHLLWSGVGGQLLSYHVGGLYCMSSLEGPFRGAFGKIGVFHYKPSFLGETPLFLETPIFKEFFNGCLLFFPCDSDRGPFLKGHKDSGKVIVCSLFEKLQVMVNCAQGRSRSAKFTIATWMQQELFSNYST